jgi:pyocin large subunit-like protein
MLEAIRRIEDGVSFQFRAMKEYVTMVTKFVKRERE